MLVKTVRKEKINETKPQKKYVMFLFQNLEQERQGSYTGGKRHSVWTIKTYHVNGILTWEEHIRYEYGDQHGP